MAALPVRGPAVRDLDVPLPPARMPLVRGTRPLKRWRYVGVFTPDLSLCVGEARVGVLPQRWWAVATPDGAVRERTTTGRGGVVLEPGRVSVRAPGVGIQLELEEGEGVEVASATGRQYAWTRKQAGVPARGSVRLDGRELPVEAEAVVDDSAGYHARRTSWHWSAGVGRGAAAERIAWNLVAGVHDAVRESERTLWIDGESREVAPVAFASDLSRISFEHGGRLDFEEWCVREHRSNLLLLRSDYRQPFGSFRGELPGGVRLVEGFGVMEQHDVLW